MPSKQEKAGMRRKKLVVDWINKLLSPIETQHFHDFIKIDLGEFLKTSGLRVEKEKAVFGHIFKIFVCMRK